MEKSTNPEVSAMVSELESELAAETAPETEEPKVETPAEQPKEEPKTESEPKKVETRTRKAELIPASKFHEVRHELQAEKEERKRLEDEIERMKTAGKPADNDDIEAIAKEVAGEQADPEVVKRIILAAQKQNKAPDTSELEKRLARIEAEKAKQEDEFHYQREERDVLEKFPELKGYAKDLKDMAYTEGNEKIPLEYLALKLRTDLNLDRGVAPAETVSAPPAGHARDMSKLTEDDFEKLGDNELDLFIERNRLKR